MAVLHCMSASLAAQMVKNLPAIQETRFDPWVGKIPWRRVTAPMKLKDAPWKESYGKPRQYITKQRHHFADQGPFRESYDFSSSHVWMWELDLKKAEHQRTYAFELWCWRRFLRVPWIERRSNQSILKDINPEYSLERLMLKLKFQYFDHLMRRADSFEKTLMHGKIEAKRRRKQRMKMAR